LFEAFLANATLSRWWTIRLNLAKVFSTTAYAEMCNAIVLALEYNDFGKEGNRSIAREVSKVFLDKCELYFLIGARLLLNDVRNTPDEFYDLRDKMTQDEFDHFTQDDRSCMSAYQMIKRLIRNGDSLRIIGTTDAVTQIDMQNIINRVVEMQSAAKEILAFVHTQVQTHLHTF